MITDLRINKRGELEGKVEMPQWDEMYTKDQVVDMLKDLQSEIEEVEIFKNVIGWELAPKTPTNLKQDCIAIIQKKINELEGES